MTASVVTPCPGFVIKGTTSPASKLFLNVCFSNLVREPHEDVAGRLRIPMALGPVELDYDKKGAPCTVIDIIVSEDTAKRATADTIFKSEFTDILLSAINVKYSIQVSDVRPLKMGYKGAVVRPQKIRLERNDTIREEIETNPDTYDLKFSFHLMDESNGNTVDVLELPLYKSTDEIIRENLANEFAPSKLSSTSTVDLSRFTRAELKIFEVGNPWTMSLRVSNERLQVSSSSLKLYGESNVRSQKPYI